MANRTEITIHSLLDAKMGQAMERFILFLRNEKRVSPNTVSSYLFDIHSLLEFLTQKLHRTKGQKATKGSKITKAHLEQCNITEFREWIFQRMSNNISHRSNARAISGVKKLFKFLETEGILENKAISQISKPKFGKALPKVISTEMFQQFCEGIQSTSTQHWHYLRDKAIATIMFTAGLRISEVLSIQTKEIINSERGIYITGKGNKTRLVPIINVAKDAIMEYIQSCPFKLEEKGSLFLSNKGKKYPSRILQRHFENARHAKNLPEYITPHTMRHSCATILLQNSPRSDSIKKIQELLGHAQLATTQIYTHVTNSGIINALEQASYWEGKGGNEGD